MAEGDLRDEIIARLDSGKTASSADVLRLLRENDDLGAENSRLQADITARDFELDALGKENWRLAEMLAKGVFIESATLQPDRYDIRTRGAGAMLLAEKLVLFFKASGGENFVTSTIEMEFTDPKECERYALTIQKLDGEDSPAQKLDRQARRITDLEDALRPFARVSDIIPPEVVSNTGIPISYAERTIWVAVEDFRRAAGARALLQKKDAPEERE